MCTLHSGISEHQEQWKHKLNRFKQEAISLIFRSAEGQRCTYQMRNSTSNKVFSAGAPSLEFQIFCRHATNVHDCVIASRFVINSIVHIQMALASIQLHSSARDELYCGCRGWGYTLKEESYTVFIFIHARLMYSVPRAPGGRPRMFFSKHRLQVCEQASTGLRLRLPL